MDSSSVINYFITVFMLCSPLAAIPVFLSLSAGRQKKERTKIALSAGISVACILILATWFGAPLLSMLGIRIAAFQIAGSMIVFLLALSMLNAELSHMRHTEEEIESKAHSMAVVPLAIPVMAGPGAISAVIVSAHRYSSLIDLAIFSVCGIAIGALATLTLYFAIPLEKKLGPSGLNIVTRIGGLILAAMGVEIFISGLEGLGIYFSSS